MKTGILMIALVFFFVSFIFIEDVKADRAIYNFSTANGHSAVVGQSIFNDNSTGMAIPPAFTTATLQVNDRINVTWFIWVTCTPF